MPLCSMSIRKVHRLRLRVPGFKGYAFRSHAKCIASIPCQRYDAASPFRRIHETWQPDGTVLALALLGDDFVEVMVTWTST